MFVPLSEAHQTGAGVVSRHRQRQVARRDRGAAEREHADVAVGVRRAVDHHSIERGRQRDGSPSNRSARRPVGGGRGQARAVGVGD